MESVARLTSGAKERDAVSVPAHAPVPLAVTRVRLTNFRSYVSAELRLDPAPVVLAGVNGSGKTNLLEAVSLLSPGRGLRGAKLSEFQRMAPHDAERVEAASQNLWAVSAAIARPGGEWDIGTGLAPGTASGMRRALHLNGAACHSADFAAVAPMLWLTPAMDRLFTDSTSERRRFLDRLVFALDHAHARRVTRYETAMRERMHVLRDRPSDHVWLDGLERTMAETGAAIMVARAALLETLNNELSARAAASPFPCAHLDMSDAPAEEDILLTAFSSTRLRDAETGRTTVGPHLTDLLVRHTVKRMAARDCSTGEQKALLISIVLANAWLQKARNDGVAPLLLLDEVVAHLDAQRRAALFEEILNLGTQAFLSGTDRSLFSTLSGRSQFFAIASGQFMRQD